MAAEAALAALLVVGVVAVVLELLAGAVVAAVVVQKLERAIVEVAVLAAQVVVAVVVAVVTAVVVQGAAEGVSAFAVHALLLTTAASSVRRKRALRENLGLGVDQKTNVTNAPHVNRKMGLESINAFLKKVVLAIALAAESVTDARLAAKMEHALMTPAGVSTVAPVPLIATVVLGLTERSVFRT